jgi:hypothetical protein
MAMAPAMSTAQKLTSAARRLSDTHRAELESFDDFLDAHSRIAHKLQRNPWLVANEEFMISHPELDEFLKNHPAVSVEVREHPEAFVRREQRFEEAGEHVSRYELDSFDHLLEQRPLVAAQLKANPGLVDDNAFLSRHGDLQEFFEDHPHLRENLKQRPWAFLDGANTWEHSDYQEPVAYHPMR